MRVLILPLILAATSATAAPPRVAQRTLPLVDAFARPPASSCTRADVHQADTPKPAEARKLGELPPGDLILSVYNEVDGCVVPMIVRYGDERVPLPFAPEPVRPRARIFR
ncbi:MAG TPA: hypothetical protein VF655_02345 [Allosphingosinicella sp.]|jgi:hypothetical protein